MANYQDETLDRLLTQFSAKPRMMRAWAAPYLMLRLGHPVVIAGPPADPFSDGPPFDFGKDGKLTFPGWHFEDARYRLVDLGLLIRADGVAAFLDKNDPLAAARLQAFDEVWAEVGKRLPHVEGEKEANPFVDGGSPATRPRLHPAWRSVLVDARRRNEAPTETAQSELAREISTWDRIDAWDKEAPPAIFEKVVAAGPAAIDPLLDCLEHDKRWTRFLNYEHGVTYGDGGKGPARLLRVRDLAIFALERVLRFPVIDMPFEAVPIEDSSYAKTVSDMREFCKKYDHACGGELWFRLLDDPDADLGDQLAAAKLIVRPDGVEDYYPDSFYPPTARERFDAPAPSKEGKLLRGRRDPAVLDLLKQAYQRARLSAEKEIANDAVEASFPSCGGGTYSFPRGVANQFIRLMEEWQPGNVDVLKSHYDWLAAAVSKLRTVDGSGAFMISRLCEEILIRRLWSKDETAMKDYEKLFRSSLEFNEAPIEVMTEFPEHPGMDQLAKEAFLGDKAPLRLAKPWKRYDFSRQFQIGGLGERSPLLVLPSFRQALVEALKIHTKQGKLSVGKDGGILSYDADKPDETETLSKDAALLCDAAAGTTIEVRLCDLVAYSLTPKRGSEVWVSPAYHLDDPLPLRDLAIKDWIKILSAPVPR